jgi:predicted acylesterase/phospholipase RssA
MAADSAESVRRERALHPELGPDDPLPPASYLAISGGGEDGAFGAGILVGWTATGTRPEFKLVTGISTGALTAPFAFLGPAYDQQLKQVYTDITVDDVAEPRGYLSTFLDDAAADTTPLRQTLARYITPQLLDAIAAEDAKGRILLVSTTNLDARRPVIWNMTRLAASHRPEAVQLFRDILLASAAIPGAFPPVMIDVEVGGRHYQEMHVDGGASAQVFVYPPELDFAGLAARYNIRRERRLYVIRNARLDPQWAQVDRWTLSIAQRAVSSLTQTQGVGDLYRIYLQTRRDNIDFNLAYIPASFDVPYDKPFDAAYMRPLYNLGYSLASRGYPWGKLPPAFSTAEAEAMKQAPAGSSADIGSRP